MQFEVVPETCLVDEPVQLRIPVYYLRVMQRNLIDGWPVFGWTSPVWVACGQQE